MGIPQSPPRELFGPPKLSGATGEESDTEEDAEKVRVGSHVQILGLPTHSTSLFVWLFGLV